MTRKDHIRPPERSNGKEYKNLSEEELHLDAQKIIQRMSEYGTKDHKKFTQELLAKYTAVNQKNREKKEKQDYPQNWQSYNQAQMKEKMLLMSILDELLGYTQFPEDKGVGRNPIIMRDRIFYLVMQSYNIKSSRRCISDMEIAKRLGYVQKTPHFNTVLKIQKDASVTPFLKHLIQVSGIPLQKIEKDFAVDSSGFSTSEFGRWLDVRTGTNEQKRKYVKAHLTCGVKTNIISAVNITKSNIHDTTEFVDLVNATSKIYGVRQVSADKGYISRENLEFVWDMGAIPFIPFKKNVKITNEHMNGVVWRKMLRFFTDYPEEFYHHYHKRSNVESTFSMLKRKFNSHLRSRSEAGQINEVLTKCLCHNLCVLVQEAFELGIDLDDLKKCADIKIAHE